VQRLPQASSTAGHPPHPPDRGAVHHTPSRRKAGDKMQTMTLDLESLNVETFEPDPSVSLAMLESCTTEDSCPKAC
jgi:hypothetical protein